MPRQELVFQKNPQGDKSSVCLDVASLACMEARGCVLNHAGIHIPSISLVLLPLSGFKPRLAISRFLTYLRQISRLTDLAQCRNRGWPNYCGAFFLERSVAGTWGVAEPCVRMRDYGWDCGCWVVLVAGFRALARN